MILKFFFKKMLGSNYEKLRSRNILKKIFKSKYEIFKNRFNNFRNRFKFNLSKTISSQQIIKNEKGFLLDFTKNSYLTFHLRPKTSDNFFLESTCKIDDSMGIIIQGPVGENYDFLKNTLDIYKKLFKSSSIVVSTWKSEKKEVLKELESKNITILFNDEPDKSQSNLNHQIVSTNAGLDLLANKGIKYALKTRTDTRLNKNNLESFLIALVKSFPLKKRNDFINSRIIVPNINTYKYRLYSLTDIIMFGETLDLLKYFDKEPYEIGLKKFDIKKDSKLINDTPLVAEIFLCSRYLQKINGNINWSLDGWWESLKDYFCIIDNSSLDLFWLKYEWDYEFKYSRTYAHKFARGIDFQDWFSLYNNSKNNWKSVFSEHEKYDEKMKIKNFI